MPDYLYQGKSIKITAGGFPAGCRPGRGGYHGGLHNHCFASSGPELQLKLPLLQQRKALQKYGSRRRLPCRRAQEISQAAELSPGGLDGRGVDHQGRGTAARCMARARWKRGLGCMTQVRASSARSVTRAGGQPRFTDKARLPGCSRKPSASGTCLTGHVGSAIPAPSTRPAHHQPRPPRAPKPGVPGA